MSTTGSGGFEVAARAADRLFGPGDAASRELRLGTLQVWHAVRERVTRRPAHAEVTLVFTDLVGFSEWALRAGDDAMLRLLRWVAQVVEPPMIEAGGQVVKRMGDGIMAVFPDPVTAITAVRNAREALKTVEVQGYTPTMRVGIHTGRPQRIGSDWLGVDVNIAARVMECADKDGVLISGATLQRLTPEQLDELGVWAKRVRRAVFAQRHSGVPADMAMYRLEPAGSCQPSIRFPTGRRGHSRSDVVANVVNPDPVAVHAGLRGAARPVRIVLGPPTRRVR